MNSRYNSAFKIRRNLTDAGCEEQMIQDFFELGKEHGAPSNTDCWAGKKHFFWNSCTKISTE